MKYFSIISLAVFTAACGTINPQPRDGSSLAQVASSPTHFINAEGVNVRNADLQVFSTAKYGERVALTGRSKSGMGHVFKEVYFFSEPTGYGWVAENFLSPAGAEPTGSPKIVITLSTNRLSFYRGNSLVRSWNVGTAREGKVTPVGNYRILEKETCPPYFGDGTHNVPGCTPENPFGPKVLWFIGTTYGIHGTNKPWLISDGTSADQRRVSGGCVRNENANIEWLWSQVSVGTPIEITW